VSNSSPLPRNLDAPRPWDARLARLLVTPLKNGPITPNHLTTLRLGVGIAAAAAFVRGSYEWFNIGALLLILSNFLDHADGELARICGKSSRFGHCYDLACDAAVTILAFVAMGVGASAAGAFSAPAAVSPVILGAVAGTAVTVIFFLRMRIEEVAGKTATRQPALGGFEAEDVLYLLPLVTLFGAVNPLLLCASIGAPLFAAWVAIDYRKYSVTSGSNAA
jgi:phosphatidylglycerophosphate synthase